MKETLGSAAKELQGSSRAARLSSPAGWAGDPGLFDAALLCGGRAQRCPKPHSEPAQGTEQGLAGCWKQGRGLLRGQTMLLSFEGLMAEGMGMQEDHRAGLSFPSSTAFCQPSPTQTSCTERSSVSGESYAVNKSLTEGK